MPRAKPDPETVAAAIELVQGGCSMREAAEILDVTATTIARWVAQRPPPSEPAPAPAHMPAEPAPVVPLDTSDPRGLVRQLIQEQHAAIQADRAVGNMRGAASNAATLERLIKSLKQLEAAAVSDAESLTISRDELIRAEAMIDARLRALADRGPVRCAECAKALSVRWGTE